MTVRMLSGVVTQFDDQSGLGEVVADGVAYPFHCAQIADGSRTIDPEARVLFEVMPGRHGRWEAAGIRLAPPAAPPGT